MWTAPSSGMHTFNTCSQPVHQHLNLEDGLIYLVYHWVTVTPRFKDTLLVNAHNSVYQIYLCSIASKSQKVPDLCIPHLHACSLQRAWSHILVGTTMFPYPLYYLNCNVVSFFTAYNCLRFCDSCQLAWQLHHNSGSLFPELLITIVN